MDIEESGKNNWETFKDINFQGFLNKTFLH